MMKKPREIFSNPVVLELCDRLEKTSSPYEYFALLAKAHHEMIEEGVKTASPQTIADFVLFETFWGTYLNPTTLIKRHQEFFPNGPNIAELIDQTTEKDSSNTAITVSDFTKKIDELWKRLSPHDFMGAFKDYHFYMWREGIETTPLNTLINLIRFERYVGFPLIPEKIIDAYRKAQYGFVLKSIKGSSQLNAEFKKELSRKPIFSDEGTSHQAYVSVEPDWENHWGDDKQKEDLPVFWYVHKKDSPKQFSFYQGIILLRNGKTSYYDRYPMGGGPFKINDFTDFSFRNRAKLIAEHVEEAVKQSEEVK